MILEVSKKIDKYKLDVFDLELSSNEIIDDILKKELVDSLSKELIKYVSIEKRDANFDEIEIRMLLNIEDLLKKKHD